jgi:DNA-binding NarL/FixJ family response regulator
MIRVLVADDHQVVRHGLRLFLDLQEDIEVVGEAANGDEAVAAARELAPDVVLMDLVMPGVDGITATRLVHDSSPATRVLVLSSFADYERLLPALQAGVDGYLTKDTPPERVAEAVRAIHGGDPVFGSEVLRRLTEHAVGSLRRPEGTVTIAFTDVEGSTRLVDELGDEESRAVLREHDEVIRRRLEEHGGIEVEQEGDSFMIAFSSARQAVRCAVATQRAFAGHRLRVRIGMNTGDVIAEHAGYFGRTVFVASRVASEALGGEILVSEATKALAADSAGVDLVDRGERPLKGLKGLHRLYEVIWA